MTHLDEWISVVAAAERFNTSSQAIRRLVKLGIVLGRRDEAAEAQGIWPIWTFVHAGSLDEWFGETARIEHVRRIRATARPFTKEQKIAIARVFVDHLEWARSDRAATQGARKRVEAPGVPQSGPSVSVVWKHSRHGVRTGESRRGDSDRFAELSGSRIPSLMDPL
ncbi:hypothetical protein [Kocuria massiliensis]|uniref:hypothetical protein n=1 Tax=Kocuria massiliensis TaxID=1926282 RepID=UPI000A1C7E1A|nr:hypothetical protein [Kocuria massiliensis]